MSTETILEKDSMVDELDKDFNTTVLKMLKELRKIQKKLKKNYEQNRNINKEKRNHKEILKLKTWNLKLTKRIQR